MVLPRFLQPAYLRCIYGELILMTDWSESHLIQVVEFRCADSASVLISLA